MGLQRLSVGDRVCERSVKRNGTPVGGLRSEAELSEAAAKKALKKDKK
jgi:hypothetical protein